MTTTALPGRAPAAAFAPPGSARQTCLVCDAPLSAHRRLGGARVCGAFACDEKLRTTPPHERCAVCTRPLAPREWADRVCSADACRRAYFVTRVREAEQERVRAVHAAAVQRRAESARARGLDLEAYPVAVVPALEARATRLPAWRRQAFAEHLAREIAIAVARGPSSAPPEETDPPPTPTERAAFAAACATCRGFCCRNGGERAYLSADRLQRHLAEHPEQGPDGVLAAYMQHVGPTTMKHSCVYHRATGCSLPRDMRSDTCNRFHCGPLHDLRRTVNESDGRAYIAAAWGRDIHRTRVLDVSAPAASTLP